MKLATFLPPSGGAPLTGEVRDGLAVCFSDPERSVLERLAANDRYSADGNAFELDDVELLAPIPRPGAIFGIGLNYADHIAETGAPTPERPLVFMKTPRSAAAPNAPVRAPKIVSKLDYEGELAVVIGAGGTVAGYAVADDLTARDLQGAEPQWTRAKGADGFCPFGPWITTAEEVGSATGLRLRTWVNGELRQDASTSNLIFAVDELVAFIAQTCTLEPGDLILTGTPSGVGLGMDPPTFLATGDIVRIEIDTLGSIEHAIA